MAWPERLPGGKWRGCWRKPDGTKDYTRKSTHPEHPYALKRDAKKAADEAEVRARRQAAVTTGTLSADTQWGAWWDLIQPDRAKRPSDTDLTDLYIVRGYLRPRWGDTPLNGIAHKRVQVWLDSLADGSCEQWTKPSPPAPAYVRRIFATFRASLQRALDEGALDASPCAGIRLPKIPKKRKQHLSVHDAERIGAVVRDDYRDALDTILETGMRPNELCGLHADRVDWDTMSADVDMVFVSRKKVIRAWPKDKDARRVWLTEKAAECIRRRLEGRDLTAGCGVPHVDGSECRSVLVFLTERGRPMNVQQMGNRLRYAAAAHEVPARTPYSGRRGFATRAARGGADAFAIASAMGHASVEQTQGYVQDERVGPVIRAALGDRAPLTVVEGGGGDEVGRDGSGSTATGS